MIGRAILAGTAAVLIGVQVVRDAAVRSLAEDSPASAARVWHGHPTVTLSQGMVEIANAARAGRQVAPEAIATLYRASHLVPLAPEPFLVRGVQLQMAGDGEAARRAFVAAKWRDGRSLPARYFLTEYYLRRRDAKRGLREIAALARLSPQGIEKLAPFIASYAADPANHAQLRALFVAEPQLEENSLGVLAHDPASADLALSLANPRRVTADKEWVRLMLLSLVSDRQVPRARKIWARLAGIREAPGEYLHDPRFDRPGAPPPFNWLLASSTTGLTERQRGGGLRVIYYGQEDGALATQLLVLPAGDYRLATQMAGNVPDNLQWSLTCAATGAAIDALALDRAVRGGWRFAVPASCPAQRLELRGVSGDTARQVDATVTRVQLVREARGE